jgi:hypothetical protein
MTQSLTTSPAKLIQSLTTSLAEVTLVAMRVQALGLPVPAVD